MSATESFNFTTPKGRLSFPEVFRPAPSMEEGKDPMYACTLIVEKDADLSALSAQIEKLIKDKWGNRPPHGLKRPIRDGSEKPNVNGFGAGVLFFTARTKRKPPVIDAAKAGITDEAKVYGGAYGKLNVTPYVFDKPTSKGVALALNGVQFIHDGEPFGSSVDVDSVFADETQDAGDNW
jgi:hypothetical protein